MKRRAMEKDGCVLAVIRPADPEAALAEAQRILGLSTSGELDFDETQEQFDRMLSAQEYTYVGIACGDLPKRGEQPLLLNHDRTVIEGDGMRPGDSFVPYDPLMHVMAQQEAPADA